VSGETITAADVKALRDRTGAGMMDCKAALAEASGDVDKAIEILRVKGQASAAQRSGRGTREGIVSAYIHANGQVGAMVEVQCETDFVARNEEFRAFAYEVAMHAAATNPRYVSSEDIPEPEREAERRVLEQKALEEGKPADKLDRILEGQLAKWAREITLLEQTHVNEDKHGGKTIEELRTDLAAKTGENVRVARLAVFRVGEG
jgi:elongation factor Ts